MSGVRVVDEVTHARVRAVIRQAQRSGRDPAVLLFDAGLLWNPAREARTRAAAMRFLAREMVQWTPAEFLRRVNKGLEAATPAEMYQAIQGWLQDHADHAERQNR